MSVSAIVGMIHKGSRSVTAVLVENDGMPCCTGRVLKKFYSNSYRVKELLRAGNFYLLKPELNVAPWEKHSIENPVDRVSIVFGRDVERDTAYFTATSGESVDDFIGKVVENIGVNTRFIYLYDESKDRWFWCKRTYRGQPFTPLKELTNDDLKI